MREAIGGTWIFSIVIVFIVLFTSFLAISVNYSKAFRVKNGIINIIEKTGYTLDKVEINDVEKDTYYATLFLVNDNGETLEIDSRPSDAIAVAIRVDAPIFVTANVISNGSVSTDSAKDEEEAQEFKKFVQSIKPSDFAKLMKDNDHHESDQ